MSQILENLWLGGADDAYHHGFIERKKITHVLNCAEQLGSDHDGAYREGLVIHHLPMMDEDYPDAEKHIRLGAYILESWFKAGYTMMVHCRAGVSRSPSIVIAWMILYQGATFDEAFNTVVKKRNIIYPNWDFMDILRDLKPKLKV